MDRKSEKTFAIIAWTLTAAMALCTWVALRHGHPFTAVCFSFFGGLVLTAAILSTETLQRGAEVEYGED